METVVISKPMIEERVRAPITRQMVYTLLDAGIPFDGPFELINGEIVYKMPKKRPHIFVTFQAMGWLTNVFGRDFVQEEKPVATNTINEPEPDIAVLTHSNRHYLTVGTPPASDVRLLIEVADSTLAYDLRIKADLYAAANVPDYWVVDINGRQIYVHRDPHHGVYQNVAIYSETETIAPLVSPASATLISTLLP